MARQKKRLPIILSCVCITFLLLSSIANNRGAGGRESLPPIDPQQVQDQEAPHGPHLLSRVRAVGTLRDS